MHQVYVGRAYPPITTQVIVTQHVAFPFPPYRLVFVYPKCCRSVELLPWKREDPQRALELQRREGENKEDELPAACQIQSERKPEDSSPASIWSLSETTGAGCKQPQHAWLTGLPVSHGCMNTLTRQQQTGTLCDGCSQAPKKKNDDSRSQPVDTSKSCADFRIFHAWKLPLKQLNWHSFYLFGGPRDNCSVRFQPLLLVLPPNFYFYPLRDRKYKNHNPRWSINRGLLESARFSSCQCESRPLASETVKAEWCNRGPICVCCYLLGALQHSATDQSYCRAHESRFRYCQTQSNNRNGLR